MSGRFAPVVPLTGTEMLRALLAETRNKPVGEGSLAPRLGANVAGGSRTPRRMGR